MATTKYKLADQVLRLINGGNYGPSSKVKITEAMAAVEQCLNRILKMEYLNVNLKSNELIPNGASVATYSSVAVTQSGTVSKSVLPAMPIKLPRGMGVYEVFDPANPNDPFIPLEMGQLANLSQQPMINNLLGLRGYQWYGTDIIYTSDISGTIPNVTIRLVVLDISQYAEWDILPVPADMELQIIEEVYKLYSTEPIADKLVDPGVNEQRNIPVTQQSQP